MRWYRLDNRIKVKEIGKIVTRNRHPTRTLPCCVVGFVISGTRTIGIFEEILRLRSGDIFFLPANVEHRGVETDNHGVIFFHFDCGFNPVREPTDCVSDAILLPTQCQIPSDVDCIDLLESLNDDFAIHKSSLGHYFSLQLKAILQRVSIYNQKRIIEASSLSYGILDFIVKNYSENICAKDFENHFTTPYRKLNASFEESFGQTIKHKLIEMRIHKAYQFLLNGESILKTAFKCGFNDYYYFLKCFKRLRGYTPKQIRKAPGKALVSRQR